MRDWMHWLTASEAEHSSSGSVHGGKPGKPCCAQSTGMEAAGERSMMPSTPRLKARKPSREDLRQRLKKLGWWLEWVCPPVDSCV